MNRVKTVTGARVVVFLLLSVAILILVAGPEAALTASLASLSFGGGNTVGSPGNTVRALVAGDLDNDGDADVVSAVSANDKIAAWENDGSPFSGLWTSSGVGAPGTATYALALGDLDNDGDLDVASGSGWMTGYEVQVWQNDGTPLDGDLWASNGVGNADGVLALATGDLDDDGDLDLVSGDDGAAVLAWQNDGTPFTGTWTVQTMGSSSTDATALAVGDLDNDGDLDVVSGNAANRVSAWENDGAPFSGTWSSQDVFTTTDGIESLALADVDGDGDLDILAGCGAGEDYELTSWQNDGDPFAGAWTRHDVGSKNIGSVHAVAAADFDVDGDPDLASGAQVGAGAAEVRTWENSGSPFAGTWGDANVGQTITDVHALAVADLDRDGDPDVVAATSIITAWPNTRTPAALGNWTEVAQPSPTDDAFSVALADFDHDGKLDVAAGTKGSGVHAWRGDGGYTWTQVGAGPLPSTGIWTGVAWGQVNDANELDLAAASDGNGLRAWAVSQAGAVWDDISTGLPVTGSYQALALGHVDHDGLLDLVAGGRGLGVRVWEGAGTSWTSQKVVSDTLDFCDVAVGHVNHDGNLDVVAANCGGQGLPVWLGDGSFGLNQAPSPTTTGSYQAVALGDLDNDGDADVVAAPSNVGGARVWLGDGGGVWTYTVAISPTLTVLSLDLDDFDHDGYLDILAGLQSGGVRVWRGNGGASWTDASTNLTTTKSYYGVAFGRVDGDAALDVVGVEYGASGVRVWTAVEPPPGGWADFQPATNPPYVWERSQQVTCTVQVADVGSGLDVSTAQYRFSRDGGSSWVGGWLSATVSGPDGSTAPQVMTATNVLFDQDSETQNAIQFRIRDKAGLTGTSPIYYVAIDTTLPTNPADLGSSHTADAWSADNSIRFTWTDQGYDALSGIWGYSWAFNRVAGERPDETADQGAGPGDYTLWAIPDGDWYLHFMTRDRAGNWADPAHLGPYRIDTAPPTTPTLTSSSHTIGGWSTDNTVWMSWDSSDDGGVAGYSLVWHQNPSYYVDTTIDTTSNVTTGAPLDDGQWYLHVRAIDQAGSASGIAHLGPFGVDRTDPSGCWINAPALSASTVRVEWRYLDATSGVASYDVQVRDDTYGGGWTDWQMGTITTSAVYTGATHLGTYSFRVRARDQAGNVSGYDCQDQTTMEDLGVADLEVTQVVQNLANEAPLIAGKQTYVRFYVSAVWSDVTGVDARLYGTRSGAPLSGSPLRPAGGRITVHAAGGWDRANLNDAFYFRLPSDWRSGTVQFTAEVNPARDVAEDRYDNNQITETVTFQSGGSFCVVMVPVHLHPRTYHVGDAGFWDMVALMEWLYPVSGVDIYNLDTMYPDAHPYWHYGLPGDYDRVLRDLNQLDFWTRDPCGDTHYFGMVHPDSQPSGSMGMGRRPGDVAAGVMAISRGGTWPEPVGGRTLAHELGHNFGRRHVECTGGEASGGDVDSGYPYPERPPCRIGPDDPTAYYGFWDEPGGTPQIITPTQAADLMSYGGRRWVSDWTYRALLRETTGVAQDKPPALSPAWAQASEYLFAAGLISPTGQTAELEAFYRTSDPDPTFVARSYAQELETAQSEDAYSLVLEDAAGGTLYTHTFTATALTDLNTSPANAVFAEVFPYTPAARIVLKQGATELASRSVSAHAPTVTVLSPNGGENITDQLTISWTGSDDDGDVLSYTVQYSADDGGTWRSVAVDRMTTTFEVEDVSTLPGSDRARIRVTASDGVNTGQDQSDAVFTVARKAPRAYIVEPKTGSQFEPDSTIVLRGRGIDAEDGALGATAPITWTSNLSGTLGSGGELWVSNLPTGTHRITMKVTDSDGYTGTDEITVYVGVSVDKIYLPTILKDFS